VEYISGEDNGLWLLVEMSGVYFRRRQWIMKYLINTTNSIRCIIEQSQSCKLW